MKAILPGATVGVLGSGQLGRMFAIAARRMGYRVHTFSPDSDTPTGQVADREYGHPYEDLDAVREFARNVAVVTFEFENVPAEAVEAAEALAPVRPSGSVLYTTQNRLREKNFLARNGFPVAPFRHVTSREGLTAARLARLAERMARYEAVVAGCAEEAIAALRPEQTGRWDGGALLALPEEIALRILGREIVAMAQHDPNAAEHPIRLQRLEALWRDLREALLQRRALRRTLAGTLISASPERAVTIRPEPPRRHSQKPATDAR